MPVWSLLKCVVQNQGEQWLIQNNLATTNGRYQFALAKYTKTSTSLYLDHAYTAQRPMINTLSEIVDEKNLVLQNWAMGRFSNKVIQPVSIGETIMKYNLSEFPGPATDCLIHVKLGDITAFTFSGRYLINASVQSLPYRYVGVDYYLGIEYTSSSQMYLYSSNSNHRVVRVEVFR